MQALAWTVAHALLYNRLCVYLRSTTAKSNKWMLRILGKTKQQGLHSVRTMEPHVVPTLLLATICSPVTAPLPPTWKLHSAHSFSALLPLSAPLSASVSTEVRFIETQSCCCFSSKQHYRCWYVDSVVHFRNVDLGRVFFFTSSTNRNRSYCVGFQCGSAAEYTVENMNKDLHIRLGSESVFAIIRLLAVVFITKLVFLEKFPKSRFLGRQSDSCEA